ncbi:MAG: AI-2E family transporter [bacterium]|nr:AI-2E family transporter [bacterium]
MEGVTTRREAMPPWIPRLLVLVVATVLGTLALVWALGQLRSFLLALLLSFFISFALEPGVTFLAKRGWRRGLATGVVFSLALLAGLLFVVVTLPPLVVQMASLASNVPDWLKAGSEFASERFGIAINLSNLSTDVIDLQGTLQKYAGSLATGILGIGGKVLGLVVQLFAMAFFTFYLLADGPRFRRLILSLFRPERQAEVVHIWEIAIQKTGGYVFSRALLAFASSVFTYIALLIIGVPFALALAIWVGVVSQFIPAVGTYLAAVVPVVVALTVSPLTALIVIAVLVVYQQLENLVLAPRITARTMALHPAVAFGAVLVGAALLGAVGALVALPAAAILQAFISTYVERHHVEESDPDQPDTEELAPADSQAEES